MRWLQLSPMLQSNSIDGCEDAALRRAAACSVMLCFMPLINDDSSSLICMSFADVQAVAMQALTFPPGSTNRLMFIAAFAVSGYASTKGRTSKPFNPLLGETYELVHQEKVRDSTCSLLDGAIQSGSVACTQQ